MGALDNFTEVEVKRALMDGFITLLRQQFCLKQNLLVINCS